jgi:2-hydroxy-6-oxonona-2,4-dienedioate hydrolase
MIKRYVRKFIVRFLHIQDTYIKHDIETFSLKEFFVNVKGSNIRYKQFGMDKTAGHILFIHGLGSTSDSWLDIPDALSRYFHTLALDLVGFGRSDKPITMNYTIRNFSEFILNFIRESGIEEGDKTIVVGHSLGGYIAADFAIENKDLVEKLVLIDSSGMLKKPTSLLYQYLEAAMNPSYDKVKGVFEQMFGDPIIVTSEIINSFIKRLSTPNATYAFKSAFMNSTNTQIGLTRLKLLEDTPTLILWGHNDVLIPVCHAKLFKEAIKNASVEIIEDTGHMLSVEKPAVVSEILHSFLTQNKVMEKTVSVI